MWVAVMFCCCDKKHHDQGNQLREEFVLVPVQRVIVQQWQGGGSQRAWVLNCKQKQGGETGNGVRLYTSKAYFTILPPRPHLLDLQIVPPTGDQMFKARAYGGHGGQPEAQVGTHLEW